MTAELDILYMTRVQKERFLDEEEFNRVKDSFVLDPSKLRTAKPDMIVLHPLPRVNEITRAVDNDPRAAYFRQVENGKFVRMALIYTLLKWAEGEKLAAVPDLAEGDVHRPEYEMSQLPVYFSYGGCRSAFRQSGRHLPLRLLRGENPVADFVDTMSK